MSFLNPVNEPVLRFSSTDAGAPQINYNARVAGDIKTVLKACLVTGYGDKASAGWSIVNEVDHVAEFVSPSAAMSDYRLGIDDTSTSSTTWYYQYQNSKISIPGGAPSKSKSYIDAIHASNGWDMLVTQLGIYLIENKYNALISKMVARVTYFGKVKSSVPAVNGSNIAWMCVGMHAPEERPYKLYDNTSTAGTYIKVENYTSLSINTVLNGFLSQYAEINQISTVIAHTPLYFTLPSVAPIIAVQPGLLIYQRYNDTITDSYYIDSVDGRPVLCVYPASSLSNGSWVKNASHAMYAIQLDYWEY